MMIENEGLYKKASVAVDNWLELHKDETFDLDTICRQLEIHDSNKRNLITIKLSYEVNRGKSLEKDGKHYRYIDKNPKYINWISADMEGTLNIQWPFGREDNSRFVFDGSVLICPGDIIVIAGVSNTGKTTFCQNLLWENMDLFPCTLMGNEYTPIKFKRRVSRMDWKNPLNENGTPKFELIERRDNWKDIINPNNINIVDWIDTPDDNFYSIRKIIEGIQSKLRNGIAVLSIQKGEDKALGTGGQFSEHLSSLYLTINSGILYVRKCKEWYEHNPNFKTNRFDIVNSGTKFHNIRKVKKCTKCYGFSVTKHTKCDRCNTTGYEEIEPKSVEHTEEDLPI